MSNAPLMPKATAVWLVDNTALTFDQVADFTKMHPLEVRAIADGDAAQGIKGMDPISTGQLTRDEIEKGEGDPNYRLRIAESKVTLPPQAKKKGPRYTPGLAPSRAAERDPVAGAQPPRIEGRADHASGRHHQDHDRQRPRPHPLECLDPDPDGPGDARPLLADRTRFRGAARGQGEADRHRLWRRRRCCRPPRPRARSRSSSRRRSNATTSTSMRSSPS